MSRDSTANVLVVALLLCVICSVLVSATAVLLNERQERNKVEEKKRNILLAAGLFQPKVPVAEQFGLIEPRIVDIQEGTFSDAFDPATFDSRAATKNPAFRVLVPSERDLAGIKAHSRFQDVYLVRSAGRLQQIVLPVYGKGLWSTMYGFIALDRDLTTVRGFAFYEHGETPGLGGEIDNPAWKELWHGKKVYDRDGVLRIEVLKGQVDRASADAIYQVDGLAGATLTARGVSNLLRYWLGENGYQPFLDLLKKGGDDL